MLLATVISTTDERCLDDGYLTYVRGIADCLCSSDAICGVDKSEIMMLVRREDISPAFSAYTMFDVIFTLHS